MIHTVLKKLQSSRWRPLIQQKLLKADNSLRRWITFFSLENGLHPKHRIINYHQFFLDNVSPNFSVLDIGCGNGFLAYDVAGKVRHVTAIDFDQTSLATARHTYQRNNIEFLYGDVTTYRFKAQFDAIVLSNVLEHIKDRVTFLKKIGRIAPRILIRVPMIDRDWMTLLKQEMGIEYRLDPTHFTEFTEESFRDELQQAGLTITALSVRFGEIYSVITTSK